MKSATSCMVSVTKLQLILPYTALDHGPSRPVLLYSIGWHLFRLFHITILMKDFKWRDGGWNLRPSACQAGALPWSYGPSPCSLSIVVHRVRSRRTNPPGTVGKTAPTPGSNSLSFPLAPESSRPPALAGTHGVALASVVLSSSWATAAEATATATEAGAATLPCLSLGSSFFSTGRWVKSGAATDWTHSAGKKPDFP